MKLDPRIKSLSDILTCFDIEEAKQFIGQKGYFSDVLSSFECLADRPHDVLTEVTDRDSSFTASDCRGYKCCWRFFIPESRLIEVKKKKYRPFTDTAEFFEKTGFEVGDVIYVRSKGDGFEFHLMLVGWTKNDVMLGNMTDRLTFNELFRWFELWDGEDKFKPFGVEED